VPKCQKVKNGGLDQCGTKPSEQQQLGTAGVEGVNLPHLPMTVKKQRVTKFREISPKRGQMTS